MDLQKAAVEIREILEGKRKELELTFIEDTHTYFMKDVDGVVKTNFPSVSKVLKKFYPEFPTDEAAEKKSKGDPVVKQQLIEEWAAAGDYSTNMGTKAISIFLLGVIIGVFYSCSPVKRVLSNPKYYEAVKKQVILNGECVNDTITEEVLKDTIIYKDTVIHDSFKVNMPMECHLDTNQGIDKQVIFLQVKTQYHLSTNGLKCV